MNLLHENIKAIRLEKRYSQEEVAYMLNISQNAYNRIERGLTDVNYSRLQQIADVYEMSVVDIINYPEKDNTQDKVKELKDLVNAYKGFLANIRKNELELIRLLLQEANKQGIILDDAFQKAKNIWYKENIEAIGNVIKNAEKDEFYQKIKDADFEHFLEKILTELKEYIFKIV